MAYPNRATVTIIPPGGQSFEANIEYEELSGGGIQGIIVPVNIVSSLGMFIERPHRLVLSDGREHEIEILGDPRWGFRSVN